MHPDDRQPQLVGTSTQPEGFARGDTVQVRAPRAGERGTWTVLGEVRNSGPEDPAYDVRHQRTGRPRIFRRSRLEPVPVGAPPRARQRRPSQPTPTPTLFPQATAPQTDTAQV